MSATNISLVDIISKLYDLIKKNKQIISKLDKHQKEKREDLVDENELLCVLIDNHKEELKKSKSKSTIDIISKLYNLIKKNKQIISKLNKHQKEKREDLVDENKLLCVLINNHKEELKKKSKSTAAAFLTAETTNLGYQGAYEDIVIRENDGSITAYVKGQKTGRDDFFIFNAINNGNQIHILQRNKNTQAFTYIGKGFGMVERARRLPIGTLTEDVSLMSVFKVIIQSPNVVNTLCNIPICPFTDRRLFKIGGLRTIGYTDTSFLTCFYKQQA
jgi:hypothetical protein